MGWEGDNERWPTQSKGICAVHRLKTMSAVWVQDCCTDQGVLAKLQWPSYGVYLVSKLTRVQRVRVR